MNELMLKYGTNPNQKPARIFMEDGSDLPITVLNGRPGYINLLDALNGWQLVSELKKVSGLPAATSFKHVSPAGAAIGREMSDTLKKIYWVDDVKKLSPLACAYARARGADRMSSFGDFIALSDVCDVATARLIRREVSDGVIAPGYEPKALEKLDLAISMIVLKYTQSNSVCYVKDGQAIGIGAGQQSRIHCTRLAGQKADNWWLRQSPKVLNLPFREDIGRPDRDNAIDLYIGDEYEDLLADGVWEQTFTEKPSVFTREEKKEWLAKNTDVILGSDAFFPFGDNIERAFKSGVKYVAEPGGSVRDDNVIAAANRHNMVMCFTGLRLFHH